MNGEAATARSRVYHLFIGFGIKHFHAHINHVSGREVLTFLALATLVDKILKRFIHHIKVGVEQLDILQ